MVKVFYSPSYVAAGHSFETTRKAKWIADSLTTSPILGIELVEPEPLTREQIAAVHDPKYVRAVETGEPRTLAQLQGFRWDANLWQSVTAVNGGMVAAALAALKDGVAGTLSSGFHHARYRNGRGFCTFNGLVLAAKAALAAGATSVLILDLDAHCGGGTASLIEADSRIWQFDVSVLDFDNYSPSARIWTEGVDSAADYLTTLQDGLAALDHTGPSFGLCLYNAGMDPHEKAGGIDGITSEILEDREWLVFDWCRRRGIPIAFSLDGGYIGPRLEEAGLVDLHRLTLSAAVIGLPGFENIIRLIGGGTITLPNVQRSYDHKQSPSIFVMFTKDYQIVWSYSGNALAESYRRRPNRYISCPIEVAIPAYLDQLLTDYYDNP